MRYYVCQKTHEPRRPAVLSHHDSLEDAVLAMDLWMSVGHTEVHIEARPLAVAEAR